ncbi:gliding motility protein GldC [bacterium SCSIO 12741]|nr:gliding motility protein GldC [bacterium SCSIO 12741]
MALKKTQISIDVELDENHVPERMKWSSSDNQEQGVCDATLISIWDKKSKNTLKIDLWTKDMTVDDMRIFFHQTMLTMADSYNRATGEDNMAFHMREFARYFGEETGIIDKQ